MFYIYIYFWLPLVLGTAEYLGTPRPGFLWLRWAGFSFWWILLLQSLGSRLWGSVVAVHGLRCPAECGIFWDQGSNPCPLHWQADSTTGPPGSPGLDFRFLKMMIQIYHIVSGTRPQSWWVFQKCSLHPLMNQRISDQLQGSFCHTFFKNLIKVWHQAGL